MSHYTHLTTDEREKAMVLREMGFSNRAIAARIGRHHSTISREFKRNAEPNGEYSANSATGKYRKRRNNCRPRKLLRCLDTYLYIAKRLYDCWSPEQIAERAKLDGCSFSFSYVTIYRAIHDGTLHKSTKKVLRFKGRRRKRGGQDEKRGKLQGVVSIHERPECIDDRSRIGDWESDTVHGKRNTGVFATHVCRKSGFLIASKLEAATSEAFSSAAGEVFGNMPQEARRSMTADRGSEFAGHASLSSRLNIPVYFCDPGSPWQRGSNENTNGLLRQFFPKGTSFSHVTQQDLMDAVDLINDRPRKRLGWKTPREVFFQELAHLT